MPEARKANAHFRQAHDMPSGMCDHQHTLDVEAPMSRSKPSREPILPCRGCGESIRVQNFLH